MARRLKEGDKVKVCDGSGCDSGKIGHIMTQKEFSSRVKINGRGVPVLIGHFKPVDWSREVAILCDSDEIITMFKNRLILINGGK